MSDKTTDNEAEYFARIDREKRQALADQLHAEKVAAERAEQKKLHHLRCGKCGGQMVPHPFRGVTIDVCTECSSVLLDPGELEMLAGHDSSGAVAEIAKFFILKNPDSTEP